MKNLISKKVVLILLVMGTSVLSFGQTDKMISKTGHIKFFSHTSVEDIEANNYSVTSAITKSTGVVVFSVPMQSFEFEKALMQKHFNKPDFLDTKQFPKAKYKGVITNLSEINFDKDGTYEAISEGELTIHGVTKKVKEKGTITVKDGKVILSLKMNVKLADYKIALKDGKPSTNVSENIEVTVKVEYNS